MKYNPFVFLAAVPFSQCLFATVRHEMIHRKSSSSHAALQIGLRHLQWWHTELHGEASFGLINFSAVNLPYPLKWPRLL